MIVLTRDGLRKVVIYTLIINKPLKNMKTIDIIRVYIVTFFTFLGTSYKGIGQQDSQYTQYMYNTQTVNPAYAGNRGRLSFNTLYRSQWVGLDGAPKVLTFSVNSPIKERVGAGLSFYNDEIGPSVETNVSADFSYTIPLDDKELFLSFGVKGGFNVLNVDFNKLNPDPNQIINPNDFNIDNRVFPIIGSGIYLTSKEKWYAGISIPNFLQTKHYDDLTVSSAKEKMNFYLIAGYVFNLDSNIKFKPATLLKAVSGAPLVIDVSTNFLFYNSLSLGLAYRWDASLSGLAGFMISKDLMIGYAYDWDLNGIQKYTSGSHELFLRFEIWRSKRIGYRSSRFF